jgi:hypothetical protein
MGHIRFGPLPETRKWKQVIDLIAGGAAASQLATATVHASHVGLAAAPNDRGVLESYWLLIRLPLAACTSEFSSNLRRCGMDVTDSPELLDIAVAYSNAIDRQLFGNRDRTDLGEMAQMAGVEIINSVAAPRSQTLFGSGPDDVKRAFAGLASAKQFGTLARPFFARFAFKCLDYFLSKATSRYLGDGKRFRTVADQVRFTDALRTHCDEATQHHARFAGDWFSLHRFQSTSDITREETQRFFGHAMTKLIGEFRRRESKNAT